MEKTIETIFDSYSIFRWQQGRSARDVTTAGIYHGSYFDQIYSQSASIFGKDYSLDLGPFGPLFSRGR